MATIKPILRIFDVDKAKEFYIDWLGFEIVWTHTFGDNSPVYMEIAREDLVFHLSEHHGDASPGSHVFIDNMKNLRTYHAKLSAQQYKFNKPGIDTPFYDKTALHMAVHDPFGNRITFVERNAE